MQADSFRIDYNSFNSPQKTWQNRNMYCFPKHTKF